jgi:hypothetical protein
MGSHPHPQRLKLFFFRESTTAEATMQPSGLYNLTTQKITSNVQMSTEVQEHGVDHINPSFSRWIFFLSQERKHM